MSQGPAESADLGALADLAPELASTFVSVASDIALVIDPDGVIRNVAQSDAPLLRQAQQWVGLPFVDAVTQDTRGKIQQLLKDVGSTGVSRRREVNLPGVGGLDIPVAFAAIRLGQNGPVLAVGRDLRAIAAIQQRFVEAQQELERDYWRQRQAESRYRLLFQVATDAVLVVDADTLCVVEANAAAAGLYRRSTEDLCGLPATTGVDAASRPAVDELLRTARTSGKPAEIRARLLPAEGALAPVLVDISATPFRATTEGSSQLLLLVRARGTELFAPDSVLRLADYVEHTPDAVAITDSSGRLMMANPAFLMLCPPGATESQLKGLPLGEALGDSSLRLAPLVAAVRRSGILSQARAMVGHQGGLGGFEVEISAALLDEGDQECIGFTLRRHAPTVTTLLPVVDGLMAAFEGLVAQLGQVSLPELLQDATRLAERHLIRTALVKAGGDLTTTARWLDVTPDNLRQRMQGLELEAAGPSASPPLLN